MRQQLPPILVPILCNNHTREKKIPAKLLSCVWMKQFNRGIHFFKEFKMIHDKIACLDRVFEMRFNLWYFYESF